MLPKTLRTTLNPFLLEDHISISIIVGTTAGSVIIVVILFIIYWKFDQICVRQKKTENNKEVDHIVLNKEPSLATTVNEVVNDKNKLKDEFNKLEMEAQENYTFDTIIARDNMQHNRYNDMGKN